MRYLLPGILSLGMVSYHFKWATMASGPFTCQRPLPNVQKSEKVEEQNVGNGEVV